MRWLAALASLSFVAAAGCSASASTTGHGRFPSAPAMQGGAALNVVGMTPAQAQEAAREAGVGAVSIDAEAITDASPPDTVVRQSPQAGASGAGELHLTVAVPSSPPCRAAQLSAAYVGGGLATGNDMGNVVVRDVSPSWCTLSGTSELTGLNENGVTVTNVVSEPLSTPFVLSPNAPATMNAHSQSQRPLPLGVIEADIFFSADYRDGPQPNGLCDTLQVVPAAWRVVLSGQIVLTTDNNDPSNVGFTQFTTCKGQLNTPTPPQPVQIFPDA
jgi:hypothetical protein